MKNRLLLLCLPFFCFCACKKDKQTPKPTTVSNVKQQVTFNLSGFTQTTGPVTNAAGGKLKVNDTGTPDEFGKLTYVLLDSTNNIIKIVDQEMSSDTSGGTLTDSLLPGTYYAAFLASQTSNEAVNGLPLEYSQLSYSGSGNFSYTDGTAQPAVEWRDLLFEKSKIVVGNAPLNLNFVLNRVVAEVELDVLDTLPVNGTVLSFYYSEQNAYFSVITGAFVKNTGTNIVGGRYNVTEVAGTANNTITAYTANVNGSFPVIISGGTGIGTCSTCFGGAIIQKSIQITAQQNKLTLVSGYLYSNSGNFSITTGNWNTPVTIPF